MSFSPNATNYVFECVFDAHALMEALILKIDGVVLLDLWLAEPRVRVVIPQQTLDDLFESRAHFGRPGSQTYQNSVPNVTLNELDRITNEFKNVQMEPPMTNYLTTEDMQLVQRPTSHWQDYVKSQSSTNVTSESYGNLIHTLPIVDAFVSRRFSDARSVDVIPSDELPSKTLAPIGTGRPGSKNTHGRLGSVAHHPIAQKPEYHALLRHMWFLMSRQEALPEKHIWIAISNAHDIKRGAEELGLPCMTFSQIRQVLKKEFPSLEMLKSPVLSRSSSEISLLHPSYIPPTHNIWGQRGFIDAEGVKLDGEDEVVFRGRKNMEVLARAVNAPVFKSAKFPIDNASPPEKVTDDAQTTIQIGPLTPREPRADREGKDVSSKNKPIVVDPNSFERGSRAEGSGRGRGRGRGGANHFAYQSKHHSGRSGPDPPINAPTGPRSMSHSSNASKSALSARKSSASPVANGHARSRVSLPQNRISHSTSPLDGVMQENRQLGKPAPVNGQGNAARSATPTGPRSPRPANSNSRFTPNSGREHKQIRSGHGTYVPPPRAREQHAKETSTIVTTPIDLNKPIDPNSFGRGTVPPGEKIRLESHNVRFSPQGASKATSRNGGSTRGRGGQVQGRGRNSITTERKLFDPN